MEGENKQQNKYSDKDCFPSLNTLNHIGKFLLYYKYHHISMGGDKKPIHLICKELGKLQERSGWVKFLKDHNGNSRSFFFSIFINLGIK